MTIVYVPDLEGVNHINAYSKSKTQTGRLLSNFAHTPFVCTDGKFESIEGYWYWLSCSHQRKDELRDVYGWKAKELGRELKGKDWVKCVDFQKKIEKAIWRKIQQNFHVELRLKQSTLPIVHYYSYGSPPKVIVPKEGLWIWEFYTKAREYLQSKDKG